MIERSLPPKQLSIYQLFEDYKYTPQRFGTSNEITLTPVFILFIYLGIRIGHKSFKKHARSAIKKKGLALGYAECNSCQFFLCGTELYK